MMREFTDSRGDMWELTTMKRPLKSRYATRLTRRFNGCWPSFHLCEDGRVTTAGEVPVEVARWALAQWESEE